MSDASYQQGLRRSWIDMQKDVLRQYPNETLKDHSIALIQVMKERGMIE